MPLINQNFARLYICKGTPLGALNYKLPFGLLVVILVVVVVILVISLGSFFAAPNIIEKDVISI